MATPGIAPISVVLEASAAASTISTQTLLQSILRANSHVSDLIFSPGRMAQVEINGQLIGVQGPGLRPFTSDDTRRIASDLIGDNKQAIAILREQGYCDV